ADGSTDHGGNGDHSTGADSTPVSDASGSDGTAADANADGALSDAPLDVDAGPPPPIPWIGIIGTGQSLSVGAAGIPLLSTTQPYGNMKLLDTGPDPKYDGNGDVLSLTPLVAPFRPGGNGGPYPTNVVGE